tara:strand:+ start:217 stop:678 length:462 start_codon:yes stop_codon:yes gene_type:complete
MTKKFIILFILILVLNNCGYSPIYSTKYQDFKLSNIIFSGERDINKILKRRLDNYTQNESAEKIYDVTMNSSLQKNIDTKDKKGNPTQFSLRINVDLVIVDKSGKTVEINFSEKKSYNNKDEKFELQMYENNLIQNMSEKIVSDMILFFQNPY